MAESVDEAVVFLGKVFDVEGLPRDGRFELSDFASVRQSLVVKLLLELFDLKRLF